MIFTWLVIAMLLTLAGAAVAVFAQDAEQKHDEELAYEDRIGEQQDAIALARCDVDPPCRDSHAKAGERVRAHKARKRVS
ncbi:hypothetical protein EPO34_01985 [Patescibacteria group bacterium]|nr:MAG: hypothetical protein EPO34_01985 [Patescibacteria group bacterium]